LEEDNWSLRSPEVHQTIELEKLVEDNCSLRSLRYNWDWTWQLDLPDGYFQLQRTFKEVRRWRKEEESEGRRGRKKEVETQAQTVLTLGLDQITKFVYFLVRVTYSGLTQNVFRLDRV
jgi:hypothetical protein